MIETAHKHILDRETPKKLAEEQLQDPLSLMREFANYGSNLIIRCFVSSKREVQDLVILGSLLKQFVAMVDGAEILLSNGAQHTAELQVRALFEQELYLKWIFSADTERRAKLYYVWNLRKKRYWLSIPISGTPENTKFTPHFSILPRTQAMSSSPETIKSVKEDIATIDNLLASTDFANLNAEFDKLKDKRSHDVPWYYPFEKIPTIKKLATRLGCAAEYDVAYDQGSGIAHSTAFFKQVSFTSDGTMFEPIRNLEGVQTMFRAIGTYCLRTYRMVLNHYRYAELEAFDRKYKDEWRARFMGIRNVVNEKSVTLFI
jgi:hypothetical protein